MIAQFVQGSESVNEQVRRGFPDTRDSLVEALASDADEKRQHAFDLVVRAYRTPVIVLLCRRWSLQTADAEDLAHEFFATALEKAWLSRYDASRGKFRTFLRTCLFAFVSSEHAHAHRQKRGGQVEHVSLDHGAQQPMSDAVVDDVFEQEWIRSVLGLALDALRQDAHAHNRVQALQLFERYDIAGADLDRPPTYAELALEFSLPVTQVTNYLAWARRRFRQHVLNTVRELTGSEEEYQAEVRALLGASIT